MDKDHPRVCGEKSIGALILWRTSGSPPRLRGKVADRGIMNRDEGITPAYAGKSCVECASIAPGWDHPRICGEKAASTAIPSRGQGSPPHMRGKGGIGIYKTFTHGITPAYAGKS